MPVRMVPTYGVLNFGCTLARNGGSSPSRAIDMKMRGWPSWKTSSTLHIAITAPSETMKREALMSFGGPSAKARAVIIGSAVPSCLPRRHAGHHGGQGDVEHRADDAGS